MKHIILILALSILPLTGCSGNTPPNLSPAGTTAFQNHRIQKVLDLIRDVAQDGNATLPPVVTTTTARRVTVWHRAAILTLHARQDGWRETVESGLEELIVSLPETEERMFKPYLALAQAVLEAVR